MKRTLVTTPTVRVDVARFAAGAHQPRHRDRQSRITFVLGGAFYEEANAGQARLAPGDVLFKSHRTQHEDRFCDAGARVASLVFEDSSYDAAEAAPWRVRRDALSVRGAVIALEAAVAGDGRAVDAATADLLGAREAARDRSAPAWLIRIKEALEAASLASIDVTAEARAAGVHPAHASRLFRRCFGASITEHAQMHCVRRAFARLGQLDRPLSDVALGAGFYDQAHMTRVFRRVTGRTPGAHRTLLAATG
ncbi:MAG TPA: AraC family transcriptional regulator [Vitreimonas sp.]|nr:AraC family transcriptional regulator [Vitreimonas sp.]